MSLIIVGNANVMVRVVPTRNFGRFLTRSSLTPHYNQVVLLPLLLLWTGASSLVFGKRGCGRSIEGYGGCWVLGGLG